MLHCMITALTSDPSSCTLKTIRLLHLFGRNKDPSFEVQQINYHEIYKNDVLNKTKEDCTANGFVKRFMKMGSLAMFQNLHMLI